MNNTTANGPALAAAGGPPGGPATAQLLLQPCPIRGGWTAINVTHGPACGEVAHAPDRKALVQELLARYENLAPLPMPGEPARCLACGDATPKEGRTLCRDCA